MAVVEVRAFIATPAIAIAGVLRSGLPTAVAVAIGGFFGGTTSSTSTIRSPPKMVYAMAVVGMLTALMGQASAKCAVTVARKEGMSLL